MLNINVVYAITHSIYVEVELDSNIFCVNRIKLIVDKLLLFLKHGFIRSNESVILNSISTN